jgi:hypothetical protein
MDEKITEEKITEEKRKPGRPRLKPVKERPTKQCIVPAPSNNGAIVELRYDDPPMLKKLAAYWKSQNSGKTTLEFSSSCLNIYSTSFSEKSRSCTIIKGDKVVSYYCSEPREVTIKTKNLSSIFNNFDKSDECITFLLYKDSWESHLHMIIKNDYDSPKYIKISTCVRTSQKPEFDKLPELPAISFRLQGKLFKKMICDISGIKNKQWTIQKYENEPLSFPYKSPDDQIDIRSIPDNGKDKKQFSVKINIKDPLFSVSVAIDDIKPFSSNMLAQWVNFKIWQDHPIWSTAKLDADGAIEINTLTDIVNYRNVKGL